jgi:PAT family beta-lactamase induction signal transducer AmpG
MMPSLKILNNKQLSMVLLGFASGLPYMLIFSTLATWLAVADIDIKTIGFFCMGYIDILIKGFMGAFD